jgi:hypothetical protein
VARGLLYAARMRLASLLLPALLTAAAGCIIVIDDDDEPGRPDPRPVPDAGWGSPDAGPSDAGAATLPVELGCGRFDETLPPLSVQISGDVAFVEVQHGGGCGEHAYRVCWDGSFLESSPVQVRLAVEHRGDDPCDAILQPTLIVDLTALRDAYRDTYQTWNGAISIGFRPGGFGGLYLF